MPKTLFVTRPNHDSYTAFLFYWSALSIEGARQLGYKVYDLQGDDVTRKSVHSLLREVAPDLVVINGHGNEDEITGQNYEVLISSDDGVELLAGKVVYMRACEAGANLGPASISAGATAFIGYTRKVVFIANSHKPEELNEGARLTIEPTEVLINSILAGDSIAEAREKFQAKYEENRAKLSSSVRHSYHLPFYEDGMDSSIFLGNLDARLS